MATTTVHRVITHMASLGRSHTGATIGDYRKATCTCGDAWRIDDEATHAEIVDAHLERVGGVRPCAYCIGGQVAVGKANWMEPTVYKNCAVCGGTGRAQ